MQSNRASMSSGDEARMASTSASASTSTLPKRVRAEERAYQSEMMFIGQRCHLKSCNREDFLPFRCGDCKETFCSQHFGAQQHACPTPTQSFVVPLCPLCHEPPSMWKRDEDPNVAMNAHLTPNAQTGLIECTAITKDGRLRHDGHGVVNGHSSPRVKRPNECNERRCKKLMVVPIQCPTCSLKFCPSHRAPNQHDCTHNVAAAQQRKPSSTAAARASPGAKLLDSLAAKRAALAHQQQQSSTAAAIDADGEKKKNVVGFSSSNTANPIKAISAANANRKTDKRAKSEQLSAIKAMQARHKKGLLTQAEQMKLAQDMAELHMDNSEGDGAKKNDCTIA